MTAPGSDPSSGPVPAFGAPPAPPGRRWVPAAPTSRDVLSAVVVAVALIIAGIPLGLLWGATTPKLDVKEAIPSSGVINEASFNTQAGVDLHFALWALIFGVVAGAIVGWRGRDGGWPLPVALAVGGLGGSLLAAQIGHWWASSGVLDQLPKSIRDQASALVDFVLRSHGFHVVFPVAALLTYLIIVLATTRPEPATLPDTPDPDRYWSVPR